MARPLRIEYLGAFYHVTSRGNEQQDIFKSQNARRSESWQAKGEPGIWLRRYWEHLIGNQQDFVRHADYTHDNPVKHGHVSCVTTWPRLTLHRFVMRAVYPCDWGRYALRLIAGKRGET